MKKSLQKLSLICAAVSLLNGCAAQYRAHENSVTGGYEQSLLAGEAVKLIKQQIPANTSFSLMPQDPKRLSAAEAALERQLRREGYAVQAVLPPNSRQSGDIKEMTASGESLSVVLIPYTDTEYIELTLTMRGDRYSRLYLQQERQIAPVSDWIRRVDAKED